MTNSRKHFMHPPCLDHVSAYCAGWSGDVVAATSFTAAALIGTAPALEAQAIASPAARLRKKSVFRMDTRTRSTSNRKPSRQAEKEECVPHGYLLGRPRRQRRRFPSLPDVLQ